MDTISRLIAVADLFIETTGMKPSTVSHRAFGHTRKLQDLRNDKDIRARFADQAFEWFVHNWPVEDALPAILTEWCAVSAPKSLELRAHRVARRSPS